MKSGNPAFFHPIFKKIIMKNSVILVKNSGKRPSQAFPKTRTGS